MKLVFVTNVWNHYQGALGRALAESLGVEQFRMCLWEQQHEERRQLGWESEAPAYPWLVSAAQDRDLKTLAMLLDEAEVALIGACPRSMQVRRVRTGKLTFLASERIWKEPCSLRQMLKLRQAAALAQLRWIANHSNAHYLAIGADAAADMRQIGAFGDRIWTWGYFAEVPKEAPAQRPKREFTVLWAGRMLPWKRVDDLLRALAMLRREGAAVRAEIIGTGPCEREWKALAGEQRLDECCTFGAPVPPEAVRERMRAADAYVLCSDRNEGWGVVANEAMAEGCVLVANTQAGASRMLVRHGCTGMLFEDTQGLASALRQLVREPELACRIRRDAWRHIRSIWSPEVAAEQFCTLVNDLEDCRRRDDAGDGPCRGT